MGNCASDIAVRDPYSRQGRKENNPNEADIVIDTNPTIKRTVKSDLKNPNTASMKNIPFPKNGIKLSHLLNQFVNDCGGRKALEGLTTTDVCNQFINTKTKKYKLSYCDLILKKTKTTSKAEEVVATATVFISHAWQCKFLDVLDVLTEHFKDEPDTIIWFDLFSYNQHLSSNLPCEWWATTFKDAIQEIGHTVLVVTNWRDPLAYTRAWCIYEAYCSAPSRSKLEIAMGSKEQNDFIQECKNRPTKIINKMLSIVNAERSEATYYSDEERIHSVMRNEVGFAKLNSIILEQMRNWVLELGLKELSKVEEESLDQVDFKFLVGNLYKDQGKYDKAEPLLIDCLSSRTSILRPYNADTLQAMNSLAELCFSQGKYDKAEQLL